MTIFLIVKLIKAYPFYLFNRMTNWLLILIAYYLPFCMTYFLSISDLQIKHASVLLDCEIKNATLLMNYIYKYKLFSDQSPNTIMIDEMTKWFKFDRLIYDYHTDAIWIKKNIKSIGDNSEYAYVANDKLYILNFNRLTIIG